MAERKKGRHLRMEERGAIKALEKQELEVHILGAPAKRTAQRPVPRFCSEGSLH